MKYLRKRWFLNFSLWTVIALLQSYQSYSGNLSEGHVARFGQILSLQLATWYPWALLTPVLFGIADRYPVDRLVSTRALVFFPLLGIGCVALQLFVHTIGMVVFPQNPQQIAPFVTSYLQMLRWMAFPHLIVYTGIIGAGNAISYYRKFRERELRAAQLEKQLAEAQLLTLQIQLQPHFFFNTLHSIASLVRDRQNDAAVSMIAQLSELLRYTMDQVNNQKVPLSQELEFINRYLEIEQTRFSDRLRVNMNVDPETYDALVPTLLLQPLVENAIKHGISHLSCPGTVDIEATRVDHTLSISISNDGVGFRNDPRSRAEGGLGLRNARQRLEQLYAGNHRFEVKECGEGRVSASILLPFQEIGSQTT